MAALPLEATRPFANRAEAIAVLRRTVDLGINLIDTAPNYGDGADYWSPQIDRGGSLPFQTLERA